ncbi:hypothetical protein HK097_011285 [Rhizophlyctis rosea]|uniref:Uncharacterized protein n=1 Tax=Rhizophlyctis rosea TaxID=64517 RepID=A0AAD5X005_9FUNG|nr:hypothetical protein HK097_011285 [Rhizophlyctis rosea]
MAQRLVRFQLALAEANKRDESSSVPATSVTSQVGHGQNAAHPQQQPAAPPAPQLLHPARQPQPSVPQDPPPPYQAEPENEEASEKSLSPGSSNDSINKSPLQFHFSTRLVRQRKHLQRATIAVADSNGDGVSAGILELWMQCTAEARLALDLLEKEKQEALDLLEKEKQEALRDVAAKELKLKKQLAWENSRRLLDAVRTAYQSHYLRHGCGEDLVQKTFADVARHMESCAKIEGRWADNETGGLSKEALRKLWKELSDHIHGFHNNLPNPVYLLNLEEGIGSFAWYPAEALIDTAQRHNRPYELV